ncbi:MAG: NAD(P)/FAD-dependent oxidoreductase [Chloroflexi bacterium]|nr:NAD(P)/FAD-dependent oxidoreductase [Chloroflexota bacterium]
MRVIIIGNGVAGVNVARAIADSGVADELIIYSCEKHNYYPRPRLIELLTGDLPPEAIAQYPDDWYQRRKIDVRLGCCVAAIDRDARRITLADGGHDTYDKLVLAIGAHSWVPPIAGAERQGVHTLRTVRDAETIGAQARKAENVVCIGGGLLGLDTSMALVRCGASPVILEALPWLMPRQLDREGAAVLQALIEARGAHVRVGVQVEEIIGDGRVRSVRLKSGEELPADLVVVSAGVRSNLLLAQQAGLSCNRGIIVNERMETDDPDIYAVGDCAEFKGMVWAIIPVALAQARVAAMQICGQGDGLYEGVVPSTTLKVTGIDLTSIGEVNPQEGMFVEKRYQNAAGSVYEKLVIRDRRIVGAILLGDRSDVRAVNQLISRGVDVAPYIDRLFTAGLSLADIVNAQ